MCSKICLTIFNDIHIGGLKKLYHETVEGKVYSDLTSDRVNDTDSKPYNKTGIHFEKKQVAILHRRLQSDEPCQNGIH